MTPLVRVNINLSLLYRLCFSLPCPLACPGDVPHCSIDWFCLGGLALAFMQEPRVRACSAQPDLGWLSPLWAPAHTAEIWQFGMLPRAVFLPLSSGPL